MYTDLLYAPPGTKVTFLNRNGWDSEPKRAREVGLVEGNQYTLSHMTIHSWHTNIYLEEFGDEPFNSVMFECEYDKEYDGWVDAFDR